MATRKPITADRLYQALPPIYKKQDMLQKPTEYPLKRFLQLTQPGWQYLEDKLLGLERLYDPDLTPSQFLDDLAAMWGFKFPVSKVAASTGRKIRGGSVHHAHLGADNVMNSVRSLSLNTVSVPVRVDLAHAESNQPTLNLVRMESAFALIQNLNANNVNVVLELLPVVTGGGEATPTNPDIFLQNWRNAMTRVLRELDTRNLRVNYVNLSRGLSALETAENSPRWGELFAQARALYKGRIVYETSAWTSEQGHAAKLALPLFSSPFLDVIAIPAHFPLSNSQRYTRDELTASLTTPSGVYDDVKAFYDEHGKPVFLTSLGVGGKEYGAKEPWNPGAPTGHPTAADYFEGQQYLYEAYENVFAANSWFLGFSATEVGDTSSAFYPVARPAQGAIANFFDLETPAYNISLTEEEKRQFLDLLPTLYAYKSSKRVFTFLGRYVFGNETDVVVERKDRTQADSGFHTINLGVTVADGVLNLGEMSTRYMLFAENFRPVNHKLNVNFTIIYFDDYIKTQMSDNPHLERMTETGTETYASSSMNDNISNDGLLSTDVESYTTSSTVDDSLHTNVLQEVSTELYDGVQSDASTDVVKTLGSLLSAPNSANRLGSSFRLSVPTVETVLPTNTH